jgi:cysteine synthase B
MSEAIVPAIYDESILNEIVEVESESAFDMARRLVREEGIFIGMSSGAAMLGAIEIAKKIDKGNIVVIFPDRGEKYLSTKLFE